MSLERDDQHRYWNTDERGREEYAGVTRTIVAAELVDDTYFTDLARGRGKLVHYFAERITTNRPLLMEIHDSVAGYLRGLRKFLDAMGPKVHAAEIIKGDSTRKLAGQIDLDVTMEGSKGVIEVKTGPPAPWHGLQLAPYSYLLDKFKWLQRARWGLYLTDGGGWKLKEYTDTSDLDYFFRAHELLMWRIRHGSFERPYGRRIWTPDNGRGGDSIPDDQAGEWPDYQDGDSSIHDA